MPIKASVNLIKKFVIHKILHIDDTPHRLALGVALGVFIGWTPTIGFQSALVILMALIFKANKVVGLPFVWISNPFTLIPIYWPNYIFGNAIIAIFKDRPRMTLQKFESAVLEFVKNSDNIFSSQTWINLYNLLLKFLDFTVDLWIGSLLIGLIMGTISYIASYKLIIWYRNHTPKGRAFMKKLLKKKNREKGIIENDSQ